MSPVRTITVEEQALAPAKEAATTKPGLKMRRQKPMATISSRPNWRALQTGKNLQSKI